MVASVGGNQFWRFRLFFFLIAGTIYVGSIATGTRLWIYHSHQLSLFIVSFKTSLPASASLFIVSFKTCLPQLFRIWCIFLLFNKKDCNFFFFYSEYYVNGCVAVFVVVFFFYWDLELMPLSTTKRCHLDFNKARSSTWLLILNGLTM